MNQGLTEPKKLRVLRSAFFRGHRLNRSEFRIEIDIRDEANYSEPLPRSASDFHIWDHPRTNNAIKCGVRE
jgi:hypothetical protein